MKLFGRKLIIDFDSFSGPLLKHIEQKTHFTEKEASLVVKDIAAALKFLHDKGWYATTRTVLEPNYSNLHSSSSSSSSISNITR